MNKTYGELFAGIGGASQGLKAAGYHGSWAIDYNRGALDILEANHNIDRVIHADVCEVNYDELPEVDLLWASPVCCSFSGANHKGGETELDVRSAQAIIRAASRARSVIIENVPAYQKSDSFSKICFGLRAMGFQWREFVLNAADYGNPSSRKRFYAVFSRSKIADFNAPAWRSTSNWFDELLLHRDCWVPSKPTPKQALAMSLNNPHNLPLKRFAIERRGAYGTPKIYQAWDVYPCCKSHSHHDGKNLEPGYGKIGNYASYMDFVVDGQMYSVTPQLLGVLMGFPIDYDWGANRAQAAAGAGNACVPRMCKILAGLT
jgi:DNA (cytosine-5)-methyltransferase 1